MSPENQPHKAPGFPAGRTAPPPGCDMVAPTLRAQRLRLVWILAVPFFVLARPTPFSLVLGGVLALPGLLLRAMAAGFIHKDRILARHGPYRHLRHPLYLGSFFAGVGLAVASGRLVVLAGYLILFPLIYFRTIRAEEAELEGRFGDDYRVYRRLVPAFLPARRKGRRRAPAPVEAPSFQVTAFVRNRAWEAPLGVLAVFLLLWCLSR